MTATSLVSSRNGPVLLSAGFRPFFLLAAAWAAAAVPIWLAMFGGHVEAPGLLPALSWHIHEMVFGYAGAAVAGFLLTAVPNWTGRPPLLGAPLASLVALWVAGRVALLLSASIGATATAVVDLAFPLGLFGIVAREILASRNWRNVAVVAVLALLLAANFLVDLEIVGSVSTAELGNRLGVATLLLLISLIGGRIIPSFTRNWLAKRRPGAALPAEFGWLDKGALLITIVALAVWVVMPADRRWSWIALAAGLALSLRLARWRGLATLREPLLWVLHLGYAWLALGLLLLGLSGVLPALPPSAAVHALTIGAIGTMTLAVMTRATLGHTGRPLTAGRGTTAIYVLVTCAAVLRVLAPMASGRYLLLLCLAAAAWSAAFGLFVALYARPLVQPSTGADAAKPI